MMWLSIRPMALSCVLGGLVVGTVFCLLYFGLLPTRIGSTRILGTPANDVLADDAADVVAPADVGPTDGFSAANSAEHADI